MMPKLPLSAKFEINTMFFTGLVRPKNFIAVAVSSKSGDLRVERYVRSWPFLLRVRLFIARAKVIRAYNKLMAFKDRHGA